MRLILIDPYSVFIFGDTADLPGFTLGSTDDAEAAAIEAARLLSAEAGLDPAAYEYAVVSAHSDGADYVVYRADVNGSEAVPVARDGQDPEAIAAVERDCRRLFGLRITKQG